MCSCFNGCLSLRGKEQQWTPPKYLLSVISLTLKQEMPLECGVLDEQHMVTPWGSQGSGSSCKPSLHAWALDNNPWFCVVSQDVPGPPTQKAQVSIFTAHKPLVLGEKDCTEQTQGRCCSLVEGMPWPGLGAHGALHAVMLLANVTCPGPQVSFDISVQFEETETCRHLPWSCKDSLILIPIMSGKAELTLTQPWKWEFLPFLSSPYSELEPNCFLFRSSIWIP